MRESETAKPKRSQTVEEFRSFSLMAAKASLRYRSIAQTFVPAINKASGPAGPEACRCKAPHRWRGLLPSTGRNRVTGRPALRVLLLTAVGISSAVAQPDIRPLAGAAWTMHAIDRDGRGADGTKLADINGDGHLDIATGWEEEGETRVYLNPGPQGAVKSPWPKVVIGKTPSSEDAVFTDLDGDGAIDVVTATEGRSCRLFIHWAPADRNQILDADAWRQEVLPAVTGLGRWLFVQPLQCDGRHGPDLILGSRPGPDTPPSVIGWLQAPLNARDLSAWKWHPLAEAGWIMSIETVDMDGDGDQDILYSDRMGTTRGIHWFENPGAAAMARGQKTPRHTLTGADVHQVMFLAIGDVDGDGLQDIVAGVERGAMERAHPNWNSRVLWLRRLDGTGRAWSEHSLAVAANTGNIKGVAISDLNDDGRADMVISTENAHGDRRGVYGLRQGATTADRDWQPFDISGAPGVKYDLVRLLDLDGDGDPDVLTNDESEGGRGLGVIWYENPRLKAK
jgi:hypothetical protein